MKKRSLERIESLVRASNDEPPQCERGEAAGYIRELIGKVNRSELPPIKRREDEPKSEARLELEAHIARLADRIRKRIEGVSNVTAAKVRDESKNNKQNPHSQEDDEPPQEILRRLWRRISKTKEIA